jgi:hypothetical protein
MLLEINNTHFVIRHHKKDIQNETHRINNQVMENRSTTLPKKFHQLPKNT